MSDVPRSLQSWVSTIQTVVLTADVFQLFIKWNTEYRISTSNERVWCTTQLAKLRFNHSNGCTHRWRFSTFYSPQKTYYTNVPDVPRSLQSWVSTVQTVVLTADVFQLVIKYIFCVWLVFVLASIITYQVFESLRYRNNVTFYPLPSLDSSIPIHATRATSDS